MQFVFEQIRTGGDRNFGYLLGDREAKVATLVDPSYQPELLVERAQAQGLEVSTIVNTHSHVDHTNGNDKAKQLTGARLAAHVSFPGGAEVPLEDKGTLVLGSFSFQVFHVPGHCPDHILLYLPEAKVAITGDLLFVGKIGGTRTAPDARTEFESLQRILAELPEETTIWPGHDYGCRPSSTLALEKSCNPFVRAGDLGAFLELKRDWPRFKAEHGLK